MALSRTKIMVGVLAVSVGGLAVWADDRNENAGRPNMTLPVAPLNTGVAQCPHASTASPCEKHAAKPSPIVVEVHTKLNAIDPMQIAVAAALEPLDFVPPANPAPQPPAPVQVIDIPLTIPSPTPLRLTETAPRYVEPMPAPTPRVTQAPPAPQYVPPPAPPVQPLVVTPPTQAPAPPTAPVIRQTASTTQAPTPSVPPVVYEAPPKPVPVAAQPLRMLLRMGNSESSRFEIKHGDELLLKVYADKMEMQAPSNGPQPMAGVTATGGVRFYGPGVSGTCEQLSIVSSTGEVLMKGHVQMKCKKGRLHNEVSADRMLFQLGGAGLVSVTDRTKKDETPRITPASYTAP